MTTAEIKREALAIMHANGHTEIKRFAALCQAAKRGLVCRAACTKPMLYEVR